MPSSIFAKHAGPFYGQIVQPTANTLIFLALWPSSAQLS